MPPRQTVILIRCAFNDENRAWPVPLLLLFIIIFIIIVVIIIVVVVIIIIIIKVP